MELARTRCRRVHSSERSCRMTSDALHAPRMAAPDPASSCLEFPASAAAPDRAMSALELDGYLTGVIVAPSQIRPGLWMACLWADKERIFEDAVQTQAALSAVGIMFNRLSTAIERSLRRLEAGICLLHRRARGRQIRWTGALIDRVQVRLGGG